MAEEQAVLLRGTTATERMALFLLEMNTRLSVRGQIDPPMRRTDIPDHLGLTSETASRAMHEFRRSKIIEFRDQAHGAL
jgi:CRP/FNR family nitrogen fixation transcriptional regulator